MNLQSSYFEEIFTVSFGGYRFRFKTVGLMNSNVTWRWLSGEILLLFNEMRVTGRKLLLTTLLINEDANYDKSSFYAVECPDDSRILNLDEKVFVQVNKYNNGRFRLLLEGKLLRLDNNTWQLILSEYVANAKDFYSMSLVSRRFRNLLSESQLWRNVTFSFSKWSGMGLEGTEEHLWRSKLVIDCGLPFMNALK